MSVLLDILSGLLLLAGSVFLLIGGVGLLRLPDFYSRLQAAGMTDTVCSISILLGLALQADTLSTVVKLLAAMLFLLFTAPLASLALAKTARRGKLMPWRPQQIPDPDPSSPPSATSPAKPAVASTTKDTSRAGRLA